MGAVTFGVPKDFVLALKNYFNSAAFVETGTNEGETSAWAASHFTNVLTVEASKPVFDRASMKLKTFPNVHCQHGSSSKFLSDIVHVLPPSIFWLDAHWCGGDTAGKHSECPLVPELAAIVPYLHRHVILIDDARYFLKPAPIEHNYLHWPSIDDIYRVLQPCQTFSLVHADTILVVPASYRVAMTDLIRAFPQV